VLDDALQALVTTASNALVSAMATDAWEQVRARVARTLRGLRGKRRREIEAALDRDVGAVESAQNQDRVRQELEGLWQKRLTELLTEDARFAPELRSLSEGIALLLSAGPDGHVQHNRAGAGGIVYAVQDGTQIIRNDDHGSGH